MALTLDFPEQGRHVFVVKGQCSAEQCVQDDPARPNVDLGSGVEFVRDDFGGSVVGRTTTSPQKLSVCHHVGQAKVGYLDILLLVQQQIFGLQIAMYNVVPAVLKFQGLLFTKQELFLDTYAVQVQFSEN